jgi:magnesium transporter
MASKEQPEPAASAPAKAAETTPGNSGRARAHRKASPRGKHGLRLPRRFAKSRRGAAPGLQPHEMPAVGAVPADVRITCIDYAPEQVREEAVHDLRGFLAAHRPPWCAVRWINVDGLRDLGVIRALAEKYHLHPLAIEDVVHVPQRPRAQPYEASGEYQARLYIVARMLQLKDAQLHSEQISIFVGHKTVLTFQEETSDDVWEPVRQRIRAPGSQIRANDASFLAYSLIDAIVDEAFPILEHFGDRLEALEDEVLQRPSPGAIQEIHRVKRELLLLRRAMWPMREVLQRLQREPHECFSAVTQTYLRDVSDHAVQIIDIVETYRELASGLTETYMTAMSNRMNEVMRLLTIIGTIFIPLTFLAGVYGMNFRRLPELQWHYGYEAFWLFCLASAGAMVTWFRRRGWL